VRPHLAMTGTNRGGGNYGRTYSSSRVHSPAGNELETVRCASSSTKSEIRLQGIIVAHAVQPSTVFANPCRVYQVFGVTGFDFISCRRTGAGHGT
jgi:hypothetical protein